MWYLIVRTCSNRGNETIREFHDIEARPRSLTRGSFSPGVNPKVSRRSPELRVPVDRDPRLINERPLTKGVPDPELIE